MIVQLRVDDRLIHGQVALMWSKALGTKGIVVANDKAAESEMVSATLKMACPASQRLLIKSVDDAIRIAADPRGRDMPIFMLVDCVADALKVVTACPDAIREVAAARELCDCGLPVFHQVTPNDAKTSVADALCQLA